MYNRFALMVCHPPDSILRARSALAFVRHLLAAGHQLPCVYFYQAGAGLALATAQISSDDFNPRQHWQQLATEHALELKVCVGSAQRRGVMEQTLATGFSIVGLGQWIAAAAAADRVIRFP